MPIVKPSAAKPSAKAPPAKLAAPSKLQASKGPAALPAALPAKPVMPSKPSALAKPSAAHVEAPSKPSVDVAALLATIDTMKDQIAALTAKKAETAKAVGFTAEEMAARPAPAADDWRAKLAGTYRWIRPVTVTRAGNVEPIEGADLVLAFLAMPSQTDLGGDGAIAKARSFLGLHVVTDDAGERYIDAPTYADAKEFALCDAQG